MAHQFPRCQIIPLPDHQTSFQIDRRECMRWHFGRDYPRPFFYPVNGPTGSSLTRMGHPGAANHDHHRSVWFAHHKVMGVDFWSDQTEARIRQTEWLCYQDGDEEATMGVKLAWHDGHDPKPLFVQELIVAIRRDENWQWQLELQSSYHPTAESLEFGQTNFGFFAVRVAKNISAYFGGGQLTNGEGRTGEPAIFGHPARWMDYSGPVPSGATEGITYFDHPGNPHFPAHWHVREDGWMGAAVGMKNPLITTREKPLKLRYLLDMHSGAIQTDRADRIAQEFADRSELLVRKAVVKHQQNTVVRAERD